MASHCLATWSFCGSPPFGIVLRTRRPACWPSPWLTEIFPRGRYLCNGHALDGGRRTTQACRRCRPLASGWPGVRLKAFLQWMHSASGTGSPLSMASLLCNPAGSVGVGWSWNQANPSLGGHVTRSWNRRCMPLCLPHLGASTALDKWRCGRRVGPSSIYACARN